MWSPAAARLAERAARISGRAFYFHYLRVAPSRLYRLARALISLLRCELFLDAHAGEYEACNDSGNAALI